MAKKIKVFIVDALAAWLRAISIYLSKERDIEIVGTATSKDDTLKFIKQNAVDIILLDVNLSCNNYDGIDALVDISEINKDIKIIMITSLKSEEFIKRSIMAGAVNYVLKDDYYEIPDMIRRAYKYDLTLSVILREYRKLAMDKYIKIENTLTPCEKELLIKKQEGLSNRELAKILNKSENTIKSQARSIRKKYGGRSLKEIITLLNALKNNKHNL